MPLPRLHPHVLRYAAILAFVVAWALAPRPARAQGGSGSILTTKHNLSASGPGPVRALDEDRVCIFCHTPHGARDVAPLWNRRDSGAGYIPYDSPTLQASPGQPTGSSKLCLSCHDGTIALGDLVSEDTEIAMSGGTTMPQGGSLIGTDLRDDHPISFPYADSLGGPSDDLVPPDTWDERIKLDAAGLMQCTTCHDPHDDTWGQFLVMDNNSAALCRQCHQFDFFDQTPHATSASTRRGGGRDPWPHTRFDDVASNSCLNCHTSHHAAQGAELLPQARDEDVCLVCHDGSVAETNVLATMRRTYRHPVDLGQGTHRAGESPLEAAGHVTCVDCHDPHRGRDVATEAPYVQGAMEGASGVTALGAPIDHAIYEYEVCFKCHADESLPNINGVERQINSTNTMREFSTLSPSSHPVVAPGRDPFVPSLRPPYSVASMIYCSDCHGSDDSESLGAVRGPHGSSHEFLLKREYRTGDAITESYNNYALCYECHRRESILGDESFTAHRLHIVDQRTPCSVCHDAHGIDQEQGNEINNAHLINFDVSVVEMDPATRRLEFRAMGPGAGSCTLRCHAVDHSDTTYP